MPKEPTCVAEGQQRLQDKIRICDLEFNNAVGPFYHNTAWQQNCLQQARNEFDAWLAQCPDRP